MGSTRFFLKSTFPTNNTLMLKQYGLSSRKPAWQFGWSLMGSSTPKEELSKNPENIPKESRKKVFKLGTQDQFYSRVLFGRRRRGRRLLGYRLLFHWKRRVLDLRLHFILRPWSRRATKYIIQNAVSIAKHDVHWWRTHKCKYKALATEGNAGRPNKSKYCLAAKYVDIEQYGKTLSNVFDHRPNERIL